MFYEILHISLHVFHLTCRCFTGSYSILDFVYGQLSVRVEHACKDFVRINGNPCCVRFVLLSYQVPHLASSEGYRVF